jgi:hypothetical protein
VRMLVAATMSDVAHAKRVAGLGDLIVTLASAIDDTAPVDTRIRPVPQLIDQRERELHRELLDTVGQLNKPYDALVQAYANTFYNYFLREFFELLLGVRAEIARETPESLVFVGPKPLRCVPIFLSRSMELPRGSQTIRAAAIMYWLKLGPWPVPTSSSLTRHDLMGNQWVRRAALPVATLGFAGRYLVRTVKAAAIVRNRGATVNKESATLVIARAPHQQRFAASIASRIDARCLVLPSFTQGDMSSDSEMIAALPNVISLRPRDVVASMYSAALCVVTPPQPVPARECTEQWRIVFPSLVTEMALEIRRFPLLLASEHLIDRALTRSPSVRSLVTFELIGREAGLLRLASRRHAVRVVAVQTVAVQGSPLPILPFADVLLTSSIGARDLLASVGTYSHGTVQFGGSPIFPVAAQPEKRSRVIAYFTQPYDFDTTADLLTDLYDIRQELTNVQFVIKLHPRDSPKNYSGSARGLIQEFRTVATVEGIFCLSPLVVARTSSVLSEAALRGLVTCAVPRGEVDRRMGMEYLQSGPHLCLDRAQLRHRLLEWDRGSLGALAMAAVEGGTDITATLRSVLCSE